MSGYFSNLSSNYVIILLWFHIFTAQIYSTSLIFKHLRFSLVTMPVNNPGGSIYKYMVIFMTWIRRFQVLVLALEYSETWTSLPLLTYVMVGGLWCWWWWTRSLGIAWLDSQTFFCFALYFFLTIRIRIRITTTKNIHLVRLWGGHGDLNL